MVHQSHEYQCLYGIGIFYFIKEAIDFKVKMSEIKENNTDNELIHIKIIKNRKAILDAIYK